MTIEPEDNPSPEMDRRADDDEDGSGDGGVLGDDSLGEGGGVDEVGAAAEPAPDPYDLASPDDEADLAAPPVQGETPAGLFNTMDEVDAVPSPQVPGLSFDQANANANTNAPGAGAAARRKVKARSNRANSPVAAARDAAASEARAAIASAVAAAAAAASTGAPAGASGGAPTGAPAGASPGASAGAAANTTVAANAPPAANTTALANTTIAANAAVTNGATVPASETTRRARALAGPPPRRSALGAWFMLVGCLVIAAPAMLVQLQQPDVTNDGEAQTLATSIHTWRRHWAGHGPSAFSTDRLVPYVNGREDYSRPPGTLWAQLAGFGFTQVSFGDSVDMLVLRARLTSVVMALLAVVAVFWAGYTIGGLKTAGFSALVCAANPVFIYYARLGDTPIYHAGWAMLSIAAAVWAIRPLRPAPSVERQFIGWVTCGLAMGAALLTAGPVAFLTVPVPIVLILVLCPQRISHLMGLLAAMLIGVLIVMPWALFAHEHDPQVWQQWSATLNQPDTMRLDLLGAQMSVRSGVLLLALVPWTLWLIGALVQPFSTSSAGSRTRMFIGWTWFAYAALIFMAMPAGGQLGDLGNVVPVLPVASLLFGQLFRQYSDLAAEGRYVRFWRLLRWPHLLILLLLSIAVPAMLYAQPWLIESGRLNDKVFGESPWWYSMGLGVVLLGLVGLSLRWMQRQYPGRVLICWAVWMLGLVATMIVPLLNGPRLVNPLRQDGLLIANVVGDKPAYWLISSSDDARRPAPAIILYAGRPLEPIAPAQIENAADEHESFYLLGSPDAAPASDKITVAARLKQSGLTVWRYNAHPPQPATASTTPKN